MSRILLQLSQNCRFVSAPTNPTSAPVCFSKKYFAGPWPIFTSGLGINSSRRPSNCIASPTGRKFFSVNTSVRVKRHQLNQSQRQAVFGGKQDERPEFLFVHAAHEHAIQFHAVESGGDRGADAGDDRVHVTAGHLPVNLPDPARRG